MLFYYINLLRCEEDRREGAARVPRPSAVFVLSMRPKDEAAANLR